MSRLNFINSMGVQDKRKIMVVIEGVSESGKKEFQLSDGEVGERTYSIDFESMEDLEKYIKLHNFLIYKGDQMKH